MVRGEQRIAQHVAVPGHALDHGAGGVAVLPRAALETSLLDRPRFGRQSARVAAQQRRQPAARELYVRLPEQLQQLPLADVRAVGQRQRQRLDPGPELPVVPRWQQRPVAPSLRRRVPQLQLEPHGVGP